MKFNKVAGRFIVIFSISFSFDVAAQLEEVIVTAQKRAESLQDVSVSVTVMTGEKLNDYTITRVEELSEYIPNLTLSETGIGTQLFIRGIGSGTNQGFEQSVGTYVDGVYYGRAQLTRSPFFDMERVEVLRGPQVTLFGNNSIGGALSLSTAKPSEVAEASVSALYEPENNEQEYIFIASGPINELLGARFSYRKYDFDGYVYNQTLGRDGPNRNFDTARLSLLFQPIESVSALLKIENSTFNVVDRQLSVYGGIANRFGNGSSTSGESFAKSTGTANMTLADIYNNRQFFPNTDDVAKNGKSLLFSPFGSKRYSNGDFSDNETNNITLSVNVELKNEYEVSAVVSHLDYTYEELCDCDFSGLRIFDYSTQEDYDQQSLEVRFTSPGGQKFDFIGGFYLQKDSLDFDDSLMIPPAGAAVGSIIAGVTPVAGFALDLADVNVPRTFDQSHSQQALFGEVTWNITDDIRIMLGARRSHYKKKAARLMDIVNADGSALSTMVDASQQSQLDKLDFVIGTIFGAYRHSESGSRERYKTSYNFIAEWDVSESILAYTSLTKGFKAGGFDVRANAPTSSANQPSNARTRSLLPGTFEFKDEEIAAAEIGTKVRIGDSIEINTAYFYSEIDSLQTSTFDGSVGFNVTNAGKAKSQGLEVEFRAALSPNLLFTASIAALDFEFVDFKNGTCIASDELIVSNELDFPLQRNCRLVDNETTRAYFSDLKGEKNIFVADYSGLVSLSYKKNVFNSLVFTSSANYSFTDDYFASENLDPNMKQPAYGKLNVRFSIGDRDEKWTASLLGRNITDEVTIGFANNVPLSSSQFAAPTYYGFFTPGRTIAAQFKYNL